MECPVADLNLELPELASLSGFDSGLRAAAPETVADPLAFCSYLKLESALKLSVVELLGQDETSKRPATLFAVAS